MAVAVAGGTTKHETWVVPAGTRRKQCLEFLETNLALAGWTATPGYPFTILYDPFGVTPTNNENFTINGRTYTLKTVINNGNADEILIGGSSGAAFNNITLAINEGAGKGTLYSTPTTANVDVTASDTTQGGNPASKFTGVDYSKLGLSVTEAGANLALTSATLASPSLECVSAETPGRLRAEVRFSYTTDADGQSVVVDLLTRDRTSGSVTASIGQTAGSDTPNFDTGKNWKLIANKHQFAFYAIGEQATNASGIFITAPWIPLAMYPKKVTNATNATPIVITTNVAHGYTTGDSVSVKYVAGNTAANHDGTITVTDPTNFQLDGTVGNGAFTGTDGLVRNTTAGKEETMEMTLASGSQSVGAFLPWRETAQFFQSQGSGMIVDGTTYAFGSGGTDRRWGLGMFMPQASDYSTNSQWKNQANFTFEPWIWADVGSGIDMVGMLWDCLVTNTSTPSENTIVADSRTWMNTIHNSNSSDVTKFAQAGLWLATN
jgi:hypothetical protein